jgi:arylsulfatase A-like enzyme
LDQVVRILDRMRSLAVYDQSAIVILADHGARVDFKAKNAKPAELQIGRFLPLLLIKPPGRSAPFAEIKTPAMLSDLPATLMPLMALTWPARGQDLLALDPNAPRTRSAVNLLIKGGWEGAVFGRETPKAYEINGPAGDAQSWRETVWR